MHYLFRTTTDKLASHLDHIAESGDMVLHIQFTGGRDWLLVCIKAANPTDFAAPGVPRTDMARG